MNTYIICYEIKNPTNIDAVGRKLKEYGTWARINANCWSIVTDQSAVTIRDALKTLIAPDEFVFVIKSGVEAAWSNSYATNDWLHRNL